MAPGTDRLSCPFCHKRLRVHATTAPESRVLCSGCSRSFKPAAPRRVPPPPLPTVPLPPVPATPPAQPRWALAAAVAGFVLLLGGAMVLALTLGRVAAPAPPVEGPSGTVAVVPAPRDVPAPLTPRGQNTRPNEPPPPALDDPPPAERPLESFDRPPLSPPAAVTAESARVPLPRDVQVKVNAAIDRGRSWLLKKQKVNGTFADQHTTALAALPALTLLECGTPPDDPVIQKAARFVRGHAARLTSGNETYELSLALLFLERLGEARDRELIRVLALRLVAGQQPDGGWGYHCPLLKEKEQTNLLTVMRLGRSRAMQPVKRQPGQPPLGPPVRGGERGGGLDAPTTTRPGEAAPPARTVAEGLPAPKIEPPRVAPDRPATPEQVRTAVNRLPPGLRSVPAVKEALRPPGAQPPKLSPARSDNSNTQFATLALWAALRQGVPVEASLALNVRRFRQYQLDDGTWKYHTTRAPGAKTTPAMTGAGLLGLAVGHGLEAGRGPTRARIDDPAVTAGLEALGRFVGKELGAEPVRPGAKAKAKGKGQPRSPINLYFLWTVERVGVLYDARLLGGKDWYRWAVEQLLATQAQEGSWHQGHYHGSTRLIDTCLALLVLKRADLAADLTGRLEFVIRTAPRKP